MARGCDYSWDHPDLNCIWSQGGRFIVRYGSRDPSKNLTKSELDRALGIGMSVSVVWQEGKTQMLRGYSGGQTDARDAKSLFDGLGLQGIPIHYACDQDTSVLSSSDISKIDSYLDGTISVTGIERNGMYGDYNIIKRQFERGKISYGWQTYVWSGGKWYDRAQLRQVQNDVYVCGGTIDWDESRAEDFGQWPRPGTPESQVEEEYMVEIPPNLDGTGPDVGFSFPKHYDHMGFCADPGRMGPDPVKVRIALHNMKTFGWDVQNVTITSTTTKVTVPLNGQYDGASFMRQDRVPITLVPNFA